MYICLECGHTFEHPKEYLEKDEVWGKREFWAVRVCPSCGGAYESAQECLTCGALIGDEQAAYGMCPECERDTEIEFERFLKQNFTKNQLEYLNNQYDGRSFGLKKGVK